MSNTDFIDDDLIQRRDAVKEVKMGPAQQGVAGGAIPRGEAVPTGDLNLTPLARRKEEINSQVATKLDELERLRARQEALEREKASLEHMRSNQEKYEAGKREMIEHLEKSLVTLEREELILNQRLALLVETDKRFKELLAEMRAFDDEQWPTDSVGLREELARTLVIIDNARKEYNKAFARIEALRESHNIGGIAPPVLPNEHAAGGAQCVGFADWIKIGLAVSLPVVLVLLALIGVLVARLY